MSKGSVFAWFSNLYAKLISGMKPQTLDLYPNNLGPEARSDLRVRKLMCDVLATVISVTLARSEDDIQIKVLYIIRSKHRSEK